MTPSQLYVHSCEIDAEPIHRYVEGGYHPVRLGDTLKDGRYKIVHKLGWGGVSYVARTRASYKRGAWACYPAWPSGHVTGGYSTVWAARDEREKRLVALKICVSELTERNRELPVLQFVSKVISNSKHPGRSYLTQLLDHFQVSGPNGLHDCLVLEPLGPNVPDVTDDYFKFRLPGNVAKRVAKEALLALDFLHQNGIAHGDLHTRNLAFSFPSLQSLEERELYEQLGEPETGPVTRDDGLPLEDSKPTYLVESTDLQRRPLAEGPIRLVDFGESFLIGASPQSLHTPLVVRAPEAIFGDKLDHRVDLWSMGCMLYELIVGQPPFNSIMVKKRELVGEMLDIASDDLPARWLDQWQSMKGEQEPEGSPPLQQWLEKCYFGGRRNKDLSREEICKVGELVKKLLYFEPSSRASPRKILEDSWFKDVEPTYDSLPKAEQDDTKTQSEFAVWQSARRIISWLRTWV